MDAKGNIYGIWKWGYSRNDTKMTPCFKLNNSGYLLDVFQVPLDLERFHDESDLMRNSLVGIGLHSNGDVYIFYTNNDNLTFSKFDMDEKNVTNISINVPEDIRNEALWGVDVLIDRDNSIHVIWEYELPTGNENYAEIYYMKLDEEGNISFIDQVSERGQHPLIRLFTNETVYVVFKDTETDALYCKTNRIMDDTSKDNEGNIDVKLILLIGILCITLVILIFTFLAYRYRRNK
jgi:hypothetical protein